MKTEELELSTGVVLNMWHGSSLAIDTVTESMKKSDPVPQPPTVHSDEKDRDEPNPNDPVYKAALVEWHARLSIRLFTVLLATSSSVKTVPEEMIRHDSPDFIEVLEMSGVEPRQTMIGLYVQWMTVVATKKDDQELLGTHLLRLAGVSEASIAEAEATFRGDEERDTDQDVPDNVNGADRDRVSVETAGPGI